MARGSYDAVIPASVRYDPKLHKKNGAKLLYGEIRALCSEKGYCWATNTYFAELYGCEERTIQNYIELLRDCEHVIVEIEDGYKRKIWISEEGVKRGVKNFSQGGEKQFTNTNDKDLNRSKRSLTGSTRGTRIDPDFKVDDEIRSWRDWKYPGITDRQLEEQREAFVDKYLSMSGSRAVMVNWNAAFKTWVRNEISWGKLVPSGVRKNGNARPARQCELCKAHEDNPDEVKPCVRHHGDEVQDWLRRNDKK